jgi:predicted dienelactone hydrolase
MVHPNADAADGKHPLVLLSHGMYGNHRNQAWLASILTKQGYIVAAIDHPGTSTFQRDADHARELWERPRDISRTIDHILADPTYAGHVDAEQIFMAGHSLGGFTAVALAGGRFDPVKFDTFCASVDADIACGVMDRWQVAKSDTDRITITRDMSDDRIKGFAVFDLGGTQSFSTNSLGAIDTPMLVIGAPENVHGLNLDVESRALNVALPSDITTYLEPAGLSHFDFMGECTENGLAILKEEEPDDVYVCEKGTSERAVEHKQIASQVMNFFESL